MERLKSEAGLSSLDPVEIGKVSSRRAVAALMLGTRWEGCEGIGFASAQPADLQQWRSVKLGAGTMRLDLFRKEVCMLREKKRGSSQKGEGVVENKLRCARAQGQPPTH